MPPTPRRRAHARHSRSCFTSPFIPRQWPEHLTETVHGLARSTLDRAQRLAELMGDLDLGEPGVVGEFDGLALRRRECLEGIHDRVAQPDRIGCADVGRIADGRCHAVLLSQTSLMGAAAQEVDGAMACDAHEPPGDSPSLWIVRLAGVPRALERVLQNLAGELAVADDADRE